MISHRILSEVATLNFVRKNTSIPVPKVLAVDTDPHNPVNARYTLQERILGHPLEDVWESLSSAQLQTIISQVARFEGELFQTRFSSIGSLLEDPDGQFSVGHLGLSCLLPQSDLHVVGPWTSSLEWIKAYVEVEIDLLDNKPDEWYSQRVDWCIPNGDAKCPVDSLQLSSYFKKWYRLFLRGIEELPMNLDLSVFDPPVTPFVLFHEELSLSNILVAYDDPARVVGIVDWEGARVVPLWACFSGHDNLLPDYSIFYTELSALRRRRQAIQASMEPAVFGARDPPFPIQYLRYIASSCASTRCSVAGLNDDLQKFLAACSQEHGQSFLELYEYINSGKPVN
ncbi:Altered inheritance of mitochondria protein 9, mitochondrial [Grifola frondosa]|uniref:Altered inheritance of mitochondria protein 9, mitochondrial n=1 Tax=Grifola frondosa TaxID=5627 RepID=A0A1C7MJQ1_GRIFR|nr:Altered inheritance of mitochondria protein 9, mitochondrial [Grifola frondosa]